MTRLGKNSLSRTSSTRDSCKEEFLPAQLIVASFPVTYTISLQNTKEIEFERQRLIAVLCSSYLEDADNVSRLALM